MKGDGKWKKLEVPTQGGDVTQWRETEETRCDAGWKMVSDTTGIWVHDISILPCITTKFTLVILGGASVAIDARQFKLKDNYNSYCPRLFLILLEMFNCNSLKKMPIT